MNDDWNEDDVDELPAAEPREPEAAAASTDEAAAAEPQLVFGSVDEFVREHLALVYRRPLDKQHGHIRWAPQWWKHPEAVSRLTALWRAWEHLRLDPAVGMAIWWRDYADTTMRTLMDKEGPFVGLAAADLASSSAGEPLPCQEPPEGYFPDVREDG